MATYASLTAAQQAQVQAAANNVRSFLIPLLNLARQAMPIQSDWNGGTSALVASLGAAEVIPNSSGLAGALGLTPGQLTTLVSYVEALAAYGDQTHIDVMTPASGAQNLA